MKIINKDNNNEVIATIITNYSMTLDEAIEAAGGEIINPEHFDDPDVIIDGKGYWLELLDIEA